MSVKVELERLLEVAEGLGTIPMLLTTDDDGRPRASAVTLTWDGTTARVRAGHRSVANASVRPLVSLLWPAPPGDRFALLVDGEVSDVEADPVPDEPSEGGRRARPGGSVTVRTTSGILHAVGRPH
jgi:Pyridoxamine 5'-phosphate oxidase